MTVFLHELRMNRIALMIWSVAIAFMIGVCVIIYPEMATQMDGLTDMFSEMGAFTDAFGMDQLNFGEFMGYFGIEVGNTLGIGGALFASIIGASALAKEEKDRTAEFLLTHPLSRKRIITEKLLAAFAQVLILNAVVVAVTCACIFAVNVDADAAKLALVFLAYFVLQIEICAVTFGISAFMRGGAIGAGLGFALGLYFLNIISNLTEELEFFKFITPFGYADGAHIVPEGAIEIKYLAVGLALSVLGIAAAYWKYTKKDIA